MRIHHLSKESHELPQPSGRKPAENIRRTKNVNELDAIKSFITEFRNLRKEQKEIAEQEIAMLNKREELKIQAKLELERMKITFTPDYEQMRLEREIMMTDPNLVPTEEGKAWIIAKQKAILVRTLQGALSGSGI